MSANSGIGRRALQRNRPGGVVGRRLVVVGEQQQAVGAVADVGEIEQQAVGQLALHRGKPALHPAGAVVLGHVGDVGGERVEARRIGQPDRVALLGDPEVGLPRGLHGHRVDHLRAVDRQHVGAAGAVEVHVADPIAAARDGALDRRPGEAQPRPEVVLVRVDGRAILQRPVPGQHHRPGLGVPVGQHVVVLGPRRGELVAQAQVEGQLVVDPPVILHVAEVHVLLQVGNQQVAQRVGRAQAEHEVGEVVEIAGRRGLGRAGETAGVLVAAVERVDVLHLGEHVLVLVAGLERVRASEPRVVDLRVEDRRVLPLRVGRLPAEVGIAGDEL